MNDIKLNELIRIGQLMRYIKDYSRGYYGTWLKGERGTKIGLLDSLIKIKETIDELNICSKTSKEIQEYIEKKGESKSVYDQRMTYLSLMLNNKAKPVLALSKY